MRNSSTWIILGIVLCVGLAKEGTSAGHVGDKGEKSGADRPQVEAVDFCKRASDLLEKAASQANIKLDEGNYSVAAYDAPLVEFFFEFSPPLNLRGEREKWTQNVSRGHDTDRSKQLLALTESELGKVRFERQIESLVSIKKQLKILATKGTTYDAEIKRLEGDLAATERLPVSNTAEVVARGQKLESFRSEKREKERNLELVVTETLKAISGKSASGISAKFPSTTRAAANVEIQRLDGARAESEKKLQKGCKEIVDTFTNPALTSNMLPIKIRVFKDMLESFKMERDIRGVEVDLLKRLQEATAK